MSRRASQRRVEARVAAGACSASASSLLWEAGRRGVRPGSRTSCRRRRRSGRRSSTTSRSIWDAAMVSGTNALVGLVARHGARRRDELPADALPPAQRPARRRSRSRSTRSRSSCSCRCSTTCSPITSEVPRRLMVTLVVYFIVLVNVAKGLRQVQPTHLELLRSYAAIAARGAAQGAHPERRAVPVHRAQDRRPGGGHHGVRRRVLRRPAERARLPHHLEPRHLEERRRVGLRARRLPARAGVLPDLHPAGEPHHTHRWGASPGGDNT